MLRSVTLLLIWNLALWCAPVLGQQPTPDSQLPDAPQQQQAQPPQPPPQPQPVPPADEEKPEKKPTGIKGRLKRGAPNCIHIGAMEKCKESKPEDEAKGEDQQEPQQPRVPENQPLPRSAHPGESSSKDSQIPLNLPGAEASGPAGDVQEVHPYNPHQADKAVEVGDFYYKRNNYRAAESRYAEALEYMANHAVATYKLAEVEEKLGKTSEARENYQKYLKLLPSGEYAAEAKKGLARLEPRAKDSPPTSPPAQKRP